METLATKYFTFLVLTIFGGGWTLPLGLPPAPEDPALPRVAPEKCLFYVSWAGMAAPDAKSKNKTEQLLAEREVQRSFATLATFVSMPIAGERTSVGQVALNQAASDWVKIIATHPTAIFATEIKNNQQCIGNLQIVRGGMLVAAGQDAEKLRAAFEQLDKEEATVKPPPAPPGVPMPPIKPRPVVDKVQIAGHAWSRSTDPAGGPTLIAGVEGTDFILGAGEGAVEEILKRRQQKPPAWLVNLRKQLPVERASMVVYLNLKMLLEQVATEKAMPKTREALRRLGLDKLSALSAVSGLEAETFTSKLLLSTDGEPQGPLLSLFSDQPLRAGDLTPIPRDATLALAMRFDAQKAVDQFTAMVEKLEPAQRTAIEQPLDALTKSLEVDLRRELPKALGSTCCVYSSPGEGGLVLLGLTAVVPIRNRDSLSVIQAKVLGSSLAKGFLSDFTPDRASHRQLHSFSFAGQRIFYFAGMGIGLAWCAADRELIVAMTPQNVMAYLQHGPEHTSLTAVPQVTRAIEGADAPSMLVYVDTAKLFELVYPIVTLLASPGMTAFGDVKQFLPLDSIPSAPAIRRHLVPGTAALRRTKHGLELTSRQPLPGTGLLWTAAVAMQSPQSVEQKVAAEGQPKDAMNRIGVTTAPASGVAVPVSTLPMPNIASDPFYSPPTIGPALPSAYAAAVPLVQPAIGRLCDIGAGVKAYRKKHHAMPPAFLADRQGKPLLSWRVALLPYLGQQALYKRFHLEESWDSPHNRQLLPMIPEVYKDPEATPDPYAATAKAAPVNDTAGKTRFLLLRGPKTVYAEASPPMPGTYEEWVKVIVVVVRSERAVPWTKPDEFAYDPKDPRAGIDGKSGADFMMLEAGGVVPAFPFLNSADTSPAAKERERYELLRQFTGEEPAAVPPTFGSPVLSPYAPTAVPPH